MKTIVAFATIALVFGSLNAFPQGTRCPEGAPGCRAEEPNWDEIESGIICPEIFDPICGRDGPRTRIFSNTCLMNAFNHASNENFQRATEEECDEAQDTDSEQAVADTESDPRWDCTPCSSIYVPVCGSDGSEVRTFSNECMMDYLNCMEFRTFSMLRSGEC